MRASDHVKRLDATMYQGEDKMKMEDLTVLEIDEKVAREILKLNGLAIEKAKAPIKALEDANAEFVTQLEEAATTIAGFKDLDVEAIEKSANDWKAKAEQHQADAKIAADASAAELAELQDSHDLVAALAERGAIDPEIVMPLLNRETIVRDDKGAFVGIDEQIKPLQEAKGYLFSDPDAKPLPKVVQGGGNQSVVGDGVLAAARDAAGLEPTNNKE